MSKKLKIGLFGGSFNPISNAHLKICQILIKKNLINKVLFIPCSFRKEKKLFASTKHRLNMLKLGLDENFRINTHKINSKKLKDYNLYKEQILIDEIEIESSEEMMPTSYLLEEYEKIFPNIDFSFIIGSDLLDQLPLWEDFEEILRYHKFFVFRRDFLDEKKVKGLLPNSYLIDNVPDKETSSTRIRKLVYQDYYDKNELKIKLGQFTTSDVVDYIIKNNLYRQ